MEKVLFLPEEHLYVRESDGCALMGTSHLYKQFSSTNWTHNIRKSAAKRYLKSSYKTLKENWERTGEHILNPAFIDYLMLFMHEDTFTAMCAEIKAEWAAKGKSTREDGTANHLVQENLAEELGYCINPWNGLEYPTQPHGKKEDGTNQNISECLCDYEPGFYSEILLWYFLPEKVFSESLGVEICGIAGTSDKGFLEPECSYVGDYKYTLEPLNDFAYEYPNYGYEMHTGPFSDWRITKTSSYRMQLNTYGWMLDQHGLPPKALWLENHGKNIPIKYEPTRMNNVIELVKKGL